MKFLSYRRITTEDEALCYDGVHSITCNIQRASASYEVFKSSVELFVTFLSKVQWIDKKAHIPTVCTIILKWIKNINGDVPNKCYISNELKVNISLMLSISLDFPNIFRCGMISFKSKCLIRLFSKIGLKRYVQN